MTYRHTRCQPTKVPARYPLVASKGTLIADLETHCRADKTVFQICRSRLERSESCGTKQRNLQHCRSCVEPSNH